jgi:N-acetylneuraminic acid mutarotase
MKNFTIFLCVLLIGCKKTVEPTAVPPLQTEAANWFSMANYSGIARHHPITFSINGFGYLGAGNGGNSTFDDFYKYDPKKNSWTKINNFGGGLRGYAYGVAYNGKAYAGFGNDQSGVLKNDLWQYDPTNDSWKELKPCPCVGRQHPAMVVANGKIYVGMGNTTTTNLKDWWEYDIATNTWTSKATLPAPARHHPYYFAANGMVYVGLGHGSEAMNGQVIYKDLYLYNPKTDTWQRKADLPSNGRVAGTQFDYKNNGYVISGDGENHARMTEGEMWRYNTQTDNWTKLTSHPSTSRWAPGCFVIDNKLYFTSGTSKTADSNDLLMFALD